MVGIENARPAEILLVEDSPTDALLAKEALEFSKVYNNLHTVVDGVEAMAFLRREGRYSNVPRPDLILLDLNLPRMDGREVLREIKSDEHLMSIPVVVLTTSADEVDVLRAYGLHRICKECRAIAAVESITDSLYNRVNPAVKEEHAEAMCSGDNDKGNDDG